MRWMLAIVLSALVGAAPAGAQGDPDALAESLRAADAEGMDWREAFAQGQRIAESPGGFAAYALAWERIGSTQVKQQLVKAWHFDLPTPFRVRLHPDTFAFFRMVLRAGERDVSGWVHGFLPTYAWREFAGDADALAWLAKVEGRGPEAVVIESQRRWAEAWSASDDAGREGLEALLLKVGHPYRRNEGLADAADRDGVAEVLAELVGSARVASPVRRQAFDALRHIWPEEYNDESWEEIEGRLRAQREVEIAREREQAEEELAERVRLVDGDAQKRWLLHAPTGPAPEAGYGLLLVFPGGDGSPAFEGFVGGAIRAQAGPEFAVVQMIAPPLGGDQNAIVWPVELLRDARVGFTMEPIAESVIESVRAEMRIDPERVYALGWSSGGPPSYTVSLLEGSVVRGAMVVMSVFKPDLLPPLAGAEGKSFYILHSPQDFIGMRFPESARDRLGAHGARVRLETYQGGHGWQGDAVSRIGEAVRWLDGAGD